MTFETGNPLNIKDSTASRALCLLILTLVRKYPSRPVATGCTASAIVPKYFSAPKLSPSMPSAINRHYF